MGKDRRADAVLFGFDFQVNAAIVLMLENIKELQSLRLESENEDKLDAIAACDKVSYCVMDEGYRNEGEWALNINSVVVFGRIRIVDDEAKKREICTNLVRKFTDDEEYLQKELTNAYQRVNCLELTIEHMTGKLVNES